MHCFVPHLCLLRFLWLDFFFPEHFPPSEFKAAMDDSQLCLLKYFFGIVSGSPLVVAKAAAATLPRVHRKHNLTWYRTLDKNSVLPQIRLLSL
jgi:hypothetical protein